MTDPAAPGGRRILVAEDEYLIARDIRRVLRAAGWTDVRAAPSVAESLRILRAEPLDAAVLDIKLLDGEVSEVAAALQARGVPFVLVTGDQDTPVPERFADAPRIDKPFTRRRLMTALQAASRAAS